jgi:hypothetical protein
VASGDPTSSAVDPIDSALKVWRQGDFALGVSAYVFVADLRKPLTSVAQRLAAEAAGAGEDLGLTTVGAEVPGLVIVSQTCDIVRHWRQRPLIELAALIEAEPGLFGHVRRARMPRYALVPALEDRRLIADLDQIVTVEKAVVAQWHREVGCHTDEERRNFARALARKRWRFAFPDDFTACARPFQDRLVRQHGKSTPEGRMLEALEEIRLRPDPSWEADQVRLILFFIRRSDAGFDDTAWEEQVSAWCAMFKLAGVYTDVFPVVVELNDMSAGDYVASDPLDLGYLSDAMAVDKS